MYHWQTLTRRRILEFVANICMVIQRYRIAKEEYVCVVIYSLISIANIIEQNTRMIVYKHDVNLNQLN